MLCIRYPELTLGRLDSLTNSGYFSHSFLTKTVWHSVKILDPFTEDEYTDQLHLSLRWTYCLLASLVAQTVKNLPAIQETWVWFLGWEDLEKGISTHSSIFAWKIPRTEEPGGLQSMGSQSWTWLSYKHTATIVCWLRRAKTNKKLQNVSYTIDDITYKIM